MEIGDLVQRNEQIWDWLTELEMKEIGMVIAFENQLSVDTFGLHEQIPEYVYAIVLWSRGGLSYEDHDDIMVVTCKIQKRVI